MWTKLAHLLDSQLEQRHYEADWNPGALDFVEAVHPEYLAIRADDWTSRAEEAFDRTPPFLDENDPADLIRKAWQWSRSAWTALLAPQFMSIKKRTIRETEPFTLGYLSGAPSGLVEFLQIGDQRWLSNSIIVGVHADVFGKECLFEAHQLCSAISAAGDAWPTVSQTNSLDAGWKAGYIEMVDLLSGDRPAGLLGRFLREGLDPVVRFDFDNEVIVEDEHFEEVTL